MTLTGEQVRKYVGRAVFDADHEMVGEVDAVYFSDDTGEPAWVSFHTDFFAERDAFVPATQIVPTGEGVSIPLPRDVIRSMPRIKPRDGALSSAQVARLHEFFGTFSGQHFASAHEGAPKFADISHIPDPRQSFKGRAHETAFGTGIAGPNEPHDVTLQGTGNSAP
ncbi:hypothetical protein Kisp01_33030 [Kineosporia sp. NBRC 101677]|uniref:PRC-barrel domain-containing protein n=1 Tax=Kineosporia sp. NBRC 101677 TaxID=3032197 RepID=UPI0024A11EDC|nr:PRC-barrel domain-containing protein [Kineosporia sp. NBRC 101677]GLY16288.1 hypothetical protein Kisp01_33030 [Kineosporia sp. NBRC 101677]